MEPTIKWKVVDRKGGDNVQVAEPCSWRKRDHDGVLPLRLVALNLHHELHPLPTCVVCTEVHIGGRWALE
jgi:hypothetical protein